MKVQPNINPQKGMGMHVLEGANMHVVISCILSAIYISMCCVFVGVLARQAPRSPGAAPMSNWAARAMSTMALARTDTPTWSSLITSSPEPGLLGRLPELLGPCPATAGPPVVATAGPQVPATTTTWSTMWSTEKTFSPNLGMLRIA